MLFILVCFKFPVAGFNLPLAHSMQQHQSPYRVCCQAMERAKFAEAPLLPTMLNAQGHTRFRLTVFCHIPEMTSHSVLVLAGIIKCCIFPSLLQCQIISTLKKPLSMIVKELSGKEESNFLAYTISSLQSGAVKLALRVRCAGIAAKMMLCICG